MGFFICKHGDLGFSIKEILWLVRDRDGLLCLILRLANKKVDRLAKEKVDGEEFLRAGLVEVSNLFNLLLCFFFLSPLFPVIPWLCSI